MAASSSDESSIPSRNFILSSSTDSSHSTFPKVLNISSSLDSGSRFSPNKHKCPLCHKSRRTFYCKECVHSGFFSRSKSQGNEGYADKRNILFELLANKQTLEGNCLKILDTRRQADILRSKIRHFKERNRILKQSIDDKQKKKNDYQKEFLSLVSRNEKRTKNLPKYEKKVEEMEQYVGDEQEKLINNKIFLTEQKQEVKKLVKVRLQQLAKYIFPISKVYPKLEMECSESDMVMALAEASQTSDLRGSWEYTENCGEMNYSIVAPTLPSSGNYTCYNMWLAQNKEGSGIPNTNTSSNTSDHKNHAFSISAALTYTTQLVQVISFYLNIGLPFKVNYSDFCNKELTEQQFTTKVARLNANILYLCFSQNVDLDSLNSCETINNILRLFDPENEDLGSDEPVELDIEKIEALEEPIVCDLQKGEDSDSEEGTSLLVEWEALPNMQYPEIAAGPANVQSTQAISTNQASSMAGGLVNSAAASIASIWKGFTGRKTVHKLYISSWHFLNMGSYRGAMMTGFICRLCSKPKPIVTHIYSNKGRSLKLLEKMRLLPIEVRKYDNLPKTICEECINRLGMQYELLQNIIKSNIIQNRHFSLHGNGRCPVECPLHGIQTEEASSSSNSASAPSNINSGTNT